MREDISKVVDMTQRRNGQNRFQVIPGDLNGDCKVKMAYGKEDSPQRRKALPFDILLEEYTIFTTRKTPICVQDSFVDRLDGRLVGFSVSESVY